MAKQFLDATGLGILWNKIKSTFLPLTGGTMRGSIKYRTSNKTAICSIGTEGNVQANEGTGLITCISAPRNNKTLIKGGVIDIIGSKTLTITDKDITISNVSIIDTAITTSELNEVLV